MNTTTPALRMTPAGLRMTVAVLIALTFAVALGGCSVLPAPTTDVTEMETAQSTGTDSTAVSDLIVDIPPEVETEPAPVYPESPAGYLDIDTLEALYRDTLVPAVDGDWDAMQDHLFALNEEVETPLPTDADDGYVQQILSLRRRVSLLAGLLAEGVATEAADSDSLVRTGFDRLTGLSYPDSLLPVIGADGVSQVADLLRVENPAVRKWLDYFTGKGRRVFARWLERKAEADSLIGSILADYELPPELIYVSLIESGLSPRARSSVGAVGPWQFMPGTARDSGLRRDWWVDERRDIALSTDAAARYIKRLYEQFGDWALVLAAYNSGEGRTARAIRLHGHDNYWDLRLPLQTTDYVPKFIAAARVGENPQDFGFEIPTVSALEFDEVAIDDATDLALIARCAGAEKSEVLRLNPALLRGASPPDSPGYAVRIPLGTATQCRRALARIPEADRLTWRKHRVTRGETLGHIARNYGTSVRELSDLNHIKNARLIHPGDQLLIPMPQVLASKARERAVEKGHYVPPKGYKRAAYDVKAGDTLGGIARKLDVSLQHLRRVNNIFSTSIIHPGLRLYAWRPSG